MDLGEDPKSSTICTIKQILRAFTLIVTTPEMCPRNFESARISYKTNPNVRVLQAKPAITRTGFNRVMMYDVGTD